jgi:hypothetical protein
MADSFDYFRRLFRNDPVLASGQPLISRPFELQEADLDGYREWVKSGAVVPLSQWINQQFQVFSTQQHTTDDGIDFFARVTGCSMLIHAGHTTLEFDDLFYFLLFLKAQLVPYQLKKGEITINNSGYTTDTRYTYVLEPPSDLHVITLQLLKKDEFPVQLRMDVKGLPEDTAAAFLKELMGRLFGK